MNSDLSYSELQNEFLVETTELENTNGIKFYLEEMTEINSCTVFIASAAVIQIIGARIQQRNKSLSFRNDRYK